MRSLSARAKTTLQEVALLLQDWQSSVPKLHFIDCRSEIVTGPCTITLAAGSASLFNTSSGAITARLPAPTKSNQGDAVFVKKVAGTPAITITCVDGEAHVDGAVSASANNACYYSMGPVLGWRSFE